MKDFESRVINAIFKLKRHNLHQFLNSKLTKDLFDARKAEFVYLRNHVAKYGLLPSRAAFKRKFPDCPKFKVKDPLEALTEDLLERKQRNVAVDLVNYLGDGDNLQDALHDCIQRIQKTAIEINRYAVENTDHEYVTSFKDRLRTYNDRKVNLDNAVFTTGLSVTDKHLNGGIFPGSLVVFAGDPAMGKSWFLCKMAVANRQRHKRGLIITPEMSEEELSYRMDALQYELNHDKLIAGKLTPRQEARWKARVRKDETPLYICDVTGDTNFTPSKLVGKIETYKPDYVIIDSAYYMRSDTEDPKFQTYKDNQNLVKQIKAIARRKNIPIICIVQMKPETEKNNMQGESALRGMYGGDHWAQGSDIAIRLTGARAESFRKVVTLKNRHGKSFLEDMVRITFDPSPNIESITNYTAEEDELEEGDEILEVKV